MSDRLRRLLRAEFIQDPWSGQAVARHLAVHRRTLSRRLRAEGTSFRSVATQIRFETAQQLLADTNMTLAQISACLLFRSRRLHARVQTLVRYDAEHLEAWEPASGCGSRSGAARSRTPS